VLMPSPRYTSYDVAMGVAGARIIDVPPLGPLDFRLDLGAVESAITPRTRALLIISPGNPTAAVADRDTLKGLAALAQHHGLTVISDEIYERIVYDGAVHTSLASLPGMAGRTITVGGFSKAYAMTGWRVGYLVGSPELVAACARLKSLWSGPTSWVAQQGAITALTHETDLAAGMVATYARRRRIALDALRSLGIEHAPAQGAFYVFFDIRRYGLPSYELSRRLLEEAGVFLYPGSGFRTEWSDHMRLAWLQPEPVLEEALTRLGDWLARHG
jgi:aspartate/methionine/tyrosine aminotransferase